MILFPWLDLFMWAVLLAILWRIIGWRATMAVTGVLVLVMIAATLLGFCLHLMVFTWRI